MTAGHRRWRFGSAVTLLATLLLAGCRRDAPPPAPAPEKPRAESDLARVTLAPDARKSLRVKAEPVRIQAVEEHRELVGWVVPRPGHEVTVTAPVAGYVQAAELPAPGQAVRKGQELLALDPVLSPLEQVQLAALRRGVENDLGKAKESLAVAASELKRMGELYEQKLRGAQEVEQAKVKLGHAREDLAAAADKLKLFTDPGKGAGASLPAVPVSAPLTGNVLTLHAGPGQYVAAAAPLVTVADMGRPWLRVPVPENDLPRVDRKRPATVTVRAAGKDRRPLRLQAHFKALVPQIDPNNHTADLLYELALPEGAASLAKDQTAEAAVPLGSERNESLVPYSAVMFDAHGGAWVYMDRTPPKAAAHVYERLRVELGPSVGEAVVVRPPLPDGARVVTEGTAALFSREFHRPPLPRAAAGKVEDDD